MLINKLVKRAKGFTLVELIVIISIIAILAVVTIFNFSTSRDTLSVNSSVQEVAIAIRQAQTYGVGVKQASSGDGNFNNSYGIYFNKSAGQNDNYIIFIDKNDNNFYDAGSGCGSGNTECIEKTTFRDRVAINSLDICASSGFCMSPSATSMQVIFTRPDIEPNILFYNGSTLVSSGSGIGNVVVLSPKGKKSSVSVYNTGLIIVNKFFTAGTK